MKILIAADMEGITGVTNWDQVDPRSNEYARFRRLMTGDVNAAARGVCSSGVNDIIVTDGHDLRTNIVLDELDPCAHLIRGDYSPLVRAAKGKVKKAILGTPERNFSNTPFLVKYALLFYFLSSIFLLISVAVTAADLLSFC
jgi:D-aminopeptidase